MTTNGIVVCVMSIMMMISIAGNYTLNIDQTHTYTDKKTDRPKYKKQQQQRKNKPTQCFIEYNNDT